MNWGKHKEEPEHHSGRRPTLSLAPHTMGPELFSGGGRNSEYPQAMWEDARQTVAGARASPLQHYPLFHQHSTPTAGQQQVEQDAPDKQGTRPALHLAQLPHTPSMCLNAHFISQLQIRSLARFPSWLGATQAGGCSDRRRSNEPALEIAFIKSLPFPATRSYHDRTCLENNGEKKRVLDTVRPSNTASKTS